MKFLSHNLFFPLCILLFSCSDHVENLNEKELGQEFQGSETEKLIDALTPSSTDLENFETLLSSGDTVLAVDVEGDKLKGSDLSQKTPKNKSGKLSGDDLEVERAFKDLEVNSLEHQKSIENLRKINQKKDQTITSLSMLNDELVSEIKRIKGQDYRNLPQLDEQVIKPVTELDSLKGEIKKLKNSLALKSEELKSLRYRNDSLEGRIIDLEKNPSISSSDLLPSFNRKQTSYEDDYSKSFTNNLPGDSTLQFEAVVTALNGKSKEAFFTEFFVLPNHLEEILRKGGIELNDYPGIDTYSELWARSRKNSFLFPGVHKSIRSLLLNFEENGNGYRIRTDVNGEAILSDLKTGTYYVIGTASLGKVGVTWSVPVELNAGKNKISLTLANSSWSL